VHLEPQNEIGRREFLEASAGLSTGLILSGQFKLDGQDRKATVTLNAWVRIGTDDTVTLIASQAEMGQGAGTTLPAILAEELGADWKRIRLEQAPVHTAYRNPRLNWQFTGNSESTTGFFDLLRQMGASARAMLVAAAADQWKVAPEECIADSGVVIQ
jgi:isoquinoline 1-oxidoreductase beta subunit